MVYPKLAKHKIFAKDILKIIAGAFLAAVSFRYLKFPNDIVSGGVTGIAQILNRLFDTPVGLVGTLINIPLFIWAHKGIGHRFTLLTLLSVLVFNGFVDLFEYWPFSITTDPMLAAVYGGILAGLGWGLIYSTGSSGGGVDIPARFLRRRYPHINYNTLIMGIDSVVVIVYAFIFKNFECCMYTLVCSYISSKVEGLVLYGPVNSRQCFIISDKSDELRVAITNQLGRGCTMLQGKGAWSGQDKQVIMCVVKPVQVTRLRQVVNSIDAHAFLVVNDARAVYGNGFEDIKNED